MNTIEKNLYEFYRVFGSVKNINLIKENGYEIIQARDKSWPQLLFNLDQKTDPRELIPRIGAAIKNEQYSPFFIAPEDYISRGHTDLLKANTMMPVKILTGMNIKPQKKEMVILPDFEICELYNDKHLDDFTHLIRKELIASEIDFNNGILNEIKSCKEVKMTGLIYRKILASAMLVLIKEGIAGLYFIVTRKEFQKRGYATTLINFELNRLYKTGVKEVVLHANHYSFGLYRNLGFMNQNRFVIYKKL